MEFFLATLLAASVSISAGIQVNGSVIDEGISRSPDHYIAGLTERVEFAGCQEHQDTEVCSLRVNLIDTYGFKSPEGDEAPTDILLMASSDFGGKPIEPIRCIVFAVPVGDTGVYGATFAMCAPSDAAIKSFEHAVRVRLAKDALVGE